MAGDGQKGSVGERWLRTKHITSVRVPRTGCSVALNPRHTWAAQGEKSQRACLLSTEARKWAMVEKRNTSKLCFNNK